jgi:hypothetical protein
MVGVVTLPILGYLVAMTVAAAVATMVAALTGINNPEVNNRANAWLYYTFSGFSLVVSVYRTSFHMPSVGCRSWLMSCFYRCSGHHPHLKCMQLVWLGQH